MWVVDTADFLQFISDGWAVAGVDVSWQAVDIAARKDGVLVTQGSQEPTGMPSNDYSVVNIWTVFDCAQQNEALHLLLGRLIEGGVLLLSGKHVGYNPDNQKTIAAGLGAETKLFPNGYRTMISCWALPYNLVAESGWAE